MTALMDAADQVWNAAYALDGLRGDRAASEWTARKVRDLMRQGRADDPDAVADLAAVLEDRLARERYCEPGLREEATR